MIKLTANRICEEYMTFEISVESLMKQLSPQVILEIEKTKKGEILLSYKERS